MATGKISRLPREIREQLNRRLDEGEPGNRLVAWLNELPAVRALLAAEFDGAAIREQNLTNWKQGGFRDWRMEQAARGLVQASSGATAAAVVTPEQIATIVAVRYVAAVREWQLSPMPEERRWRQMRVILQDVMQLRRGQQREERLELDWERLQFAVEQFEEEKQADERRAMIGFLAAGGEPPRAIVGSDLPQSEPGWKVPGSPGEALATAFRMLQERRGAEMEAVSGGIKVNQGEINFKKEEAQDGFVGCPPSPQSSPPGRGGDLARFGVQEGVTTSAALVGARMNANTAELGRIKVDQGAKKIENVEVQDGFVGCSPSPQSYP